MKLEKTVFNIGRGNAHTQSFSADWSTVSVLFRKSRMAALPAALTFSVEHHFYLKEHLTDKLVSVSEMVVSKKARASVCCK